MNRIFSIFLLCVAITSLSCTKDDEATMNESSNIKQAIVATRSSTSEFVTRPNPYAIDVMQGVYDTYSLDDITLEPTDLYVRFLPQDSIQLQSLYIDYDLELFDFPLDIDMPENAVYVDPNIAEGDFTWLYTTVKPSFAFPENIRYEILEECYIPDDDETIVNTRTGSVNVEEAAFSSLGYDIEELNPITRVRERPEGDIMVYDNKNKNYQPVKGVKVRCHRFVKWSTTFTDENGHYIMDSKFRYNPHYAIVFGNIKGFDIWGNWGPLARANYNMGWNSNTGKDAQIGENSTAWEWCATNNAAYDYYKMCEETGIPKPPANLKIWVCKNWKSSSAAMIRSLIRPFEYAWPAFFSSIETGVTVALIATLVKTVCPDITIGCKDDKYDEIHETVNHELAHASHFSKVGGIFWGRYINYIINSFLSGNGTYGDGSGNDAQLCAIGEMWGYSIGSINAYEKFNDSTFPQIDYRRWFKPEVFYKLITNSILTKKQVFDCLNSNIDTYDKLVEEMYSRYPDKADEIEAAFMEFGIVPNVEKPDTNTNETEYDAFFNTRSITSNFTYNGNNILAEDIHVDNGATLTLQGANSVTIKPQFTIGAGSYFVMALNN